MIGDAKKVFHDKVCPMMMNELFEMYRFSDLHNISETNLYHRMSEKRQ